MTKHEDNATLSGVGSTDLLSAKLTRTQLQMLKTAAEHGHAFARTGMRARGGGARSRMAQRLADAGLLTRIAPHEITDAGREFLKALND